MSLGSRVQIRYTHKLSMHKANFPKHGSLRDVLNGLDSSKFSEIFNSNATLDKFPVHQIKITFKL